MNRNTALLASLAGVAGLALAFSGRLAAALPGGGQLSVAEVKSLAEQTVNRYFPAVDPLMLRAMAEIESSRIPTAFRWESGLNEGSTGLMQTLLSTARWLYQDMGYRAMGEPTHERLLLPEVSMYFGAAYVNWLRSWKGVARSEEWIVRSYNGGPGATNSQTTNHWNKYQTAKARLIGS